MSWEEVDHNAHNAHNACAALAAIEVFDGARAIAVGRDRFLPVKSTNELLLLRSDVFALGDDRDIKGRKGLPLHRRANDADRFVFVPVIYLEKQLIVNLQYWSKP